MHALSASYLGIDLHPLLLVPQMTEKPLLERVVAFHSVFRGRWMGVGKIREVAHLTESFPKVSVGGGEGAEVGQKGEG